MDLVAVDLLHRNTMAQAQRIPRLGGAEGFLSFVKIEQERRASAAR